MAMTVILRRGSRGQLVRQWQVFLIRKEFLGAGNDTGFFGPLTDAATRRYQAARGLVADGIVGPKTFAAAVADVPPFESEPSPPPLPIADPNFPPKPDFGPLATSPHAIRMALFGEYDFEIANRPNVKILGDWERRNLVSVPIPQLARVPNVHFAPNNRIRFHRKAADQLQALWQAWEDHGLLDRVIGFEGSFNPRLIAGTNILSNHAFGTAFDINVPHNEFGEKRAAVGQLGSVRELVPLANAHGFFWGGHFSTPDGMHFEIAKLL
jgi:hypothetical protein